MFNYYSYIRVSSEYEDKIIITLFPSQGEEIKRNKYDIIKTKNLR